MNSPLTNNSLLAKNVVWNLLGGGLPLLAALVAIPILTRGMGTDRFGILTLAWVLVGYFGLFDLGISRALTKLVSDRLGTNKNDEVPDIFWTSLLLMSALGCVGSFIAVMLSPWLVDRVLSIPTAIRTDALHSFFLLAFSIPIIIGTAGFRGYLEARQCFGIANAIRVPLSAFNFVGPLLILPFTNSITAIVAVLIFGRVVAWVVYLKACLHVDPLLCRMPGLRRAVLGPIMRFGSWITVSNLVSPIMAYCDRFLVGALVSMAAVAYYATPYEAVTRVSVVSAAIASVLFPAFSTTFASDRDHMGRLFERGVRAVFLILFPVTFVLVLFAHETLRLWLGTDFAQHSVRVWQLLAVGMFVNSLAQIPFALLQGMDRPDLTAKLHLLELCLYIPSVWWATREWGIAGTATVWSLRVALDAVLLFACVWRLLPGIGRTITRLGLLALLVLPVLGASAMQMPLEFKLVFFGIALFGFAFIGWFWILTQQERVILVARAQPLRIPDGE